MINYLFKMIYDKIDRLQLEIENLTKENKTLQYKYNGLLESNREIYNKYQELIIHMVNNKRDT